MPIDFFEYAENVNPVEQFGLIDPDDKDGKKPVEISYDDSQRWNANVICNNREDYLFVPIDNNSDISITRLNEKNEEESDNRCDAMLGTEKTVCFIELKNEREQWLSHAIKQLESTIELFGDNIQKYKFKKAYACNLNHPNSSALYSNAQSSFYKKHKIVLRTKTEVSELE